MQIRNFTLFIGGILLIFLLSLEYLLGDPIYDVLISANYPILSSDLTYSVVKIGATILAATLLFKSLSEK